MSIQLAQNELYAKLSEVFNLPINVENADVKTESTCRLYVLINRVRSFTIKKINYSYHFYGVVMLTLGAPCMKPIGYLLDRVNLAIANDIMGGLGVEIFEERFQNKIQMKFEFISKPYEYTPNDNTITDINVTTIVKS